jgi:predicted RNA-binding protein with PUA-like domain
LVYSLPLSLPRLTSKQPFWQHVFVMREKKLMNMHKQTIKQRPQSFEKEAHKKRHLSVYFVFRILWCVVKGRESCLQESFLQK